MATNPIPAVPGTGPAPLPYGVIILDGQPYIERHQVFVAEHLISVPNQFYTGLRLTLPGVADFLLKGLGRDFTQIGQADSVDRFFRFRLANGEGTTWFFTGAMGIFDDRAMHTLCFGNAQFPFPLIPPVPLHANGSLIYEIEDIFFGNLTRYPYTIHLAFYGNYLIPATGPGAPVGALAFPASPTPGATYTGA
jgi:hypothetical protein